MGPSPSRCPSWIGGQSGKGDLGVCRAVLRVSADTWELYPGLGGSGGQQIKQLPREFVEFLVHYLFCQNLLTSRAMLALQGAKDVTLEQPL